MPPSQGNNSVLAKLGGRLDAAVQKHANDATDYGSLEVPAGVSGGIAKLKNIGFGEFKSGGNVGKAYFSAAGVCVEPKSVTAKDGQVLGCAGLYTRLSPIPLCDTRGTNNEIVTADEHLAVVMNIIRTLAGETATAKCRTAGDLEALCNRLANNGQPGGLPPIYFRFSTSVKESREYVDPVTKTKKMSKEGTWHNWYGSKGLEKYKPAVAAKTMTRDASAQAAVPNGAVAHAEAPAATDEESNTSGDDFQQAENEAMAAVDEAMGTEYQGGEPVSDVSQMDLDTLIETAKAGQDTDDADLHALAEAAGNRIVEIAGDFGIEPNAIAAASDYDQVKAMIEEAMVAAATPPEPEPVPEPVKPAVVAKPVAKPAASATPAASVPKVGGVFFFKADPKKKPVEVKVIQVLVANKTVTVQEVASKTMHKGVAWNKLLPMAGANAVAAAK